MDRNCVYPLNGRPKALFIEWNGGCSSSKKLQFENGQRTLTATSCPRRQCYFRTWSPCPSNKHEFMSEQTDMESILWESPNDVKML